MKKFSESMESFRHKKILTENSEYEMKKSINLTMLVFLQYLNHRDNSSYSASYQFLKNGDLLFTASVNTKKLSVIKTISDTLALNMIIDMYKYIITETQKSPYHPCKISKPHGSTPDPLILGRNLDLYFFVFGRN